MAIVFLVLFIVSSQLIHSVAVDQQQGFNPYPFGTTILCIILHPLLLISSIFYLGWIIGIAVFLCHLFGLLHCTVSWILDIPELLTNNFNQLLSIKKFKIGLLTPILLANIVFTVASFFVSEFKSVFYLFYGNIPAIIVTSIVVITLSVIRIIVAKHISKE